MFKLQSILDSQNPGDDCHEIRYLVSCGGGTEERKTTFSDIITVQSSKINGKVEVSLEVTGIKDENIQLALVKLAKVLRKYAEAIESRENNNLVIPI